MWVTEIPGKSFCWRTDATADSFAADWGWDAQAGDRYFGRDFRLTDVHGTVVDELIG
jgi:hypothetical protein